MRYKLRKDLTFNDIRYLHGPEFAALCDRYTEKQLHGFMRQGIRWDFWPQSVVILLNFEVNKDGEPKMIQLTQATIDAVDVSNSGSKDFI